MQTKRTDTVDDILAQWEQADSRFDPITEGLVGRIVRLGRHFRRLLEESAVAHGLSAEDWEALAVLRRTAPSDDATASRLAGDLMLTPSATTARIDRLERKGLVHRRPHPTNRRIVQLTVSNAGERAWRSAAAVQQDRERLVVEHLTESQRQQLNNLLRLLMLAFESPESGSEGGRARPGRRGRPDPHGKEDRTRGQL